MTEERMKQNSKQVYKLTKGALNELRDDCKNEKWRQNSTLPVSKNIVTVDPNFFHNILKIIK